MVLYTVSFIGIGITTDVHIGDYGRLIFQQTIQWTLTVHPILAYVFCITTEQNIYKTYPKKKSTSQSSLISLSDMLKMSCHFITHILSERLHIIYSRELEIKFTSYLDFILNLDTDG